MRDGERAAPFVHGSAERELRPPFTSPLGESYALSQNQRTPEGLTPPRLRSERISQPLSMDKET